MFVWLKFMTGKGCNTGKHALRDESFSTVARVRFLVSLKSLKFENACLIAEENLGSTCSLYTTFLSIIFTSVTLRVKL